MTKEEALKKIDELKKFIEQEDQKQKYFRFDAEILKWALPYLDGIKGYFSDDTDVENVLSDVYGTVSGLFDSRIQKSTLRWWKYWYVPVEDVPMFPGLRVDTKSKSKKNYYTWEERVFIWFTDGYYHNSAPNELVSIHHPLEWVNPNTLGGK